MSQDKFLENVRNLRNEGKSIRAVASELSVHPSRVQRALKALARTPTDGAANRVFVGRHQEMEGLRASLDEVVLGHGRIVALTGEPGIGKTRMVQELASHGARRRAHLFCSFALNVSPFMN